jgi:hypothetical protein
MEAWHVAQNILANLTPIYPLVIHCEMRIVGPLSCAVFGRYPHNHCMVVLVCRLILYSPLDVLKILIGHETK